MRIEGDDRARSARPACKAMHRLTKGMPRTGEVDCVERLVWLDYRRAFKGRVERDRREIEKRVVDGHRDIVDVSLVDLVLRETPSITTRLPHRQVPLTNRLLVYSLADESATKTACMMHVYHKASQPANTPTSHTTLSTRLDSTRFDHTILSHPIPSPNQSPSLPPHRSLHHSIAPQGCPIPLSHIPKAEAVAQPTQSTPCLISSKSLLRGNRCKLHARVAQRHPKASTKNQLPALTRPAAQKGVR